MMMLKSFMVVVDSHQEEEPFKEKNMVFSFA